VQETKIWPKLGCPIKRYRVRRKVLEWQEQRSLYAHLTKREENLIEPVQQPHGGKAGSQKTEKGAKKSTKRTSDAVSHIEIPGGGRMGNYVISGSGALKLKTRVRQKKKKGESPLAPPK